MLLLTSGSTHSLARHTCEMVAQSARPSIRESSCGPRRPVYRLSPLSPHTCASSGPDFGSGGGVGGTGTAGWTGDSGSGPRIDQSP